MIADVVEDLVTDAVASVGDPEYPDVSIVDLGLLESVTVTDGVARVGLIPTFSGCPALHMIAADVRNAVEQVPGIDRCDVAWLDGPSWTTDRMTVDAVEALSADYTVVVRDPTGELTCPVCGGTAVADQSMAGPTRCRSIAWCPDCRNPVEVMRTDPAPAPTPTPTAVCVSFRVPGAHESSRKPGLEVGV